MDNGSLICHRENCCCLMSFLHRYVKNTVEKMHKQMKEESDKYQENNTDDKEDTSCKEDKKII